MTPPLRSLCNIHDMESYIFNTPYDSSIDTVSCCTRELPPTPTTTCPQLIRSTKHRRNSSNSSSASSHNDAYGCMSPLAQRPQHHWSTDSALLLQRGSKADAAQAFVMTQPVQQSGLVLDSDRSAWWLYKEQDGDQERGNWWSNLFTKKTLPEKVITVECFSKHECETAGKLHQVLEECYNGKLSGRMYPHGKIVWSGTMNTNSKLSFLCHMTQHKSRIRINFILQQGKHPHHHYF
jgi:hypothetical protein